MSVRIASIPRLRGTLAFRLGLRARIFLRWLARNRIRDSEAALIVLASLLGAAVGLGVVGLRHGLALLHLLFFGTPLHGHLSAGNYASVWLLVAVPIVGGLAYGLVATAWRRMRSHEIVDPIEANALHGGRMSLRDSAGLTGMTLLSAGVGGSVGLEAAYTQSGAGFASTIGSLLRLRRVDLRVMVGCGAAAAIAAAFNAPLAGAFYAFELIIGSYELGALAPVAAAALAATLVSRELFGSEPIFSVPDIIPIENIDYLAFAGLGVLAAVLGIAAMRGVGLVEVGMRRLNVPRGLRPALGGLLLAGLAAQYPQVLSSGHGAVQMTVSGVFHWPILAGLVLAKLAASAISVGSGFRGGMFSSSLFLGSLLGALVGSAAASFWPGMAPAVVAFTLVGMGATGAAVVGAPITMILLVLEMSGNFPVTLGVTLAVLVASVVVRQTFGYSFSTWRFHLRGVRLRGAHDIGWVRDMTAGRLMRRDPAIVAADTPVGALREAFPAGAAKRLFAVDAEGKFAGVVDVAALHRNPAAIDPEATAQSLVQNRSYLVPDTPVRDALDRFAQQEVEALAVVDNADSRRLIGYLTEAYALRRYSQALERQRGYEIGDSELFGPRRGR
ncbi:MAG: chloride channel protein [Rhodospirillaceae bacterium]|nr:chloride channel protein [Rhodospirillaceae bacterium]